MGLSYARLVVSIYDVTPFVNPTYGLQLWLFQLKELQNVPEVSFGANTLGPNVQTAILFWRHPYICSTTVLHDNAVYTANTQRAMGTFHK